MSAMCNKGIYMPIWYTMQCNEKEKGQWPCRQCCKLMAWRTLVQIILILLWLEAYKSYCLPEKEIKLPFLPSMQSVHSVQTFTPQLGIVQIYVPPYSKRKSDKTTFPASLCHLWIMNLVCPEESNTALSSFQVSAVYFFPSIISPTPIKFFE